MNYNHFNKEKSKLKFKGMIASIYHRDFPKGTYEYVVMPDIVRILAVTEDNKILLNQEKLFSYKNTYYALPGGVIDKNEDPIKAAQRELEEETGYTSNEIVPWFDNNYSQTIISRKYFLIAKNCTKKSGQNLESTENIIVKKMSFDDFLEKATSDNFKHIELQARFLKMKLDNSYKEEFKKKIF